MTPRHIDTHDSPTCIRHSSWRHCRMRIRLPHRECILCWKPTSRSSMRRADNECCPDSRGSKSHIERQVLRVCQPHKMCSHRCRRRGMSCKSNHNSRRCSHWWKADCSTLRCRSGCLACTRSSSRPTTRRTNVGGMTQTNKMCSHRCRRRRNCRSSSDSSYNSRSRSPTNCTNRHRIARLRRPIAA
jgi:hypothetical protein